MWKPTPAGGPERVVAPAVGVFAIAITLLVLDFSVPSGLDSSACHAALRDLAPNLGAYVPSLLGLGLFRREHRRILGLVARVDGQVITLSLAGPGVAALVPFPAKLISEYGTSRSRSRSTRRRSPPRAPPTWPCSPCWSPGPGGAAARPPRKASCS
ncbi:TMEM175 family protein [Streptomyces violaceoruber]|uniref:TMEM175 family protein n=1 Tax=Streptomyces TaxID=1883 RepID=UPI0009979F72|nr:MULTISPECIES: TMEM175 family protein [Streptomyces]